MGTRQPEYAVFGNFLGLQHVCHTVVCVCAHAYARQQGFSWCAFELLFPWFGLLRLCIPPISTLRRVAPCYLAGYVCPFDFLRRKFSVDRESH